MTPFRWVSTNEHIRIVILASSAFQYTIKVLVLSPVLLRLVAADVGYLHDMVEAASQPEGWACKWCYR